METSHSTSPALGKLLIGALRRHGDRVALKSATENLTYAALNDHSDRMACGLSDLGVGVGDRVALLLKNSFEYVISDIAILKCGAVKVPLNDLLSAPEIAYAVEHAGARIVVVHDTLVPLTHGLDDVKKVVVSETDGARPGDLSFDDLLKAEPKQPLTPAASDQPTVIMYTGGTTGKPKGILHTSGGLGTNLLAHVMCGQIGADEKLLLTTPLPHSAGFFLQAALLQGATVRLEPTFDPEALLKTIEEEGITWSFMVPTMIYRLLDHLRVGKADASSLRTIVYGAAPIATGRINEALERFGPIFLQLFGQSECPNFATTLSKSDHLNPDLLSSCGQPCPTVEVKIGDERGAELPVGEVGEVMLRSPYTMQEYHNAPDLTAAAYMDGWLRTGDVGYQGEHGHVFLVDRMKDMIITGGMNVYTSEVEAALTTHPNIRAAAVIGVPDDDWGEAVYAFIVSDAALNQDALKSHCRTKIGKYKTPKHFSQVEELPTTPYGKIDKKALRIRWYTDQLILKTGEVG